MVLLIYKINILCSSAEDSHVFEGEEWLDKDGRHVALSFKAPHYFVSCEYIHNNSDEMKLGEMDSHYLVETKSKEKRKQIFDLN